MKKLLYSIIIINYNNKKAISKCLQSIKDNLVMKYTEIIIINNSNDSLKDLAVIYPVHIYNNKENQGFSKAVNKGIKLCKSNCIILLNDDVKIDSNFNMLLNSVCNIKNLFSVQAKMLQYYNPNKIDDAGDFYNILGWGYQRGHGKFFYNHIKTTSIFSSCAGAAIYRKDILDEIGYFDENFFAYMEDVDIGWRARIYGYKNVYCPDAIVYHVGSASSGGRYNPWKVNISARNNIYVYYKNQPLLQLLINLPFFMLGCFIKYVFFLKKGFGKEYRQGIWEGLTTLHKIKKVKFRWKHFWNYVKIEGELVVNLFRYVIDKLNR